MQPHQLMEPPTDPPAEELDDEDTLALIQDCYLMLGEMLLRKQPKGLHNELAKLVSRLDRSMSWHRLH